MADKDNYWNYAQIGLELAGAVLAGFWGGWWLDGKFGTAPWLMLGGAAAGLAAGFYLVLRELFGPGGPADGGKR